MPHYTLDVKNNAFPCEGPRVVPMSFDFSSASTFQIDFTQLVSQGKISEVQGIYIDASAITKPVTLTSNVTNQKIIIPAYSQGYLPTLTQHAQYTLSCDDGENTAIIYFLNFPVNPFIWSAGAASTGDDVNVTNNPLNVAVANTTGIPVKNDPANDLLVGPNSTAVFPVEVPSGGSLTVNTATGAPLAVGPGGAGLAAGSTVSLAVSDTSANVAIPANSYVNVTNPLTVPVFVRFGTSAQTATTADIVVNKGCNLLIASGDATNAAAIIESGETGGTIYFTGCNS